MDKRQKYSIKEKLPSSSVPSAARRGHVEPQCSYMYGGLGDLRRQPYLLKSPLKEKTVASRHNRPESTAPKTAPQWYCDAATFAAKLHAASPSGAVKVNPLLAGSRESGGEAAFHGQMSKIRRTKEREMMTAIMEVASHGKMILYQLSQ